MTFQISRRAFLGMTAAFGAASLALPAAVRAAPSGRIVTASRRTIEVNGQAASVFGLHDQTSGRPGLWLEPGDPFALSLENALGEPTIIHWHGQTPPPEQDGVYQTGYVEPIASGTSRAYDFTPRPGTHWMHSHHMLQEPALLAAPLIVRTAEDAAAGMQEHTIMLHDFSFRDPAEILAGLSGGGMSGMSGMKMGAGGMGAMGMQDLNDIEFDAFLANDRTLDDPEIVTVDAGAPIRLRIINAASATSFWLDFGGVTAQVVAVDGNAISPIDGKLFPIASAQRLDIVVKVDAGTALPVIAQREGDTARTGVILATPGAAIAKIGAATTASPAVDTSFERIVRATQPLPDRPVDRKLSLTLSGGMSSYVWTLNGRQWEQREPLQVAAGERIELEMFNRSMMAHPMHLHGHHFQIVAVDGRKIAGAMRDTVLVPPMGQVRVAFDADNPGRWLLHCHNLYHMAGGMMTELVYA